MCHSFSEGFMCIASVYTYLVVISNSLALISGMGMLIFGMLIRWGTDWLIQRNFSLLMDSLPLATVRESIIRLGREIITAFDNNSSILFVALGISLVIISIFGFCAACHRELKTVIMEATMLIIIWIIFTLFLIVYSNQRDKIRKNMYVALQDQFEETYQLVPQGEAPLIKDFTYLWDEIQYQLRCCGVNNQTDFRFLKTSFGKQDSQYRTSEEIIPSSCCKWPVGMENSFAHAELMRWNRKCRLDEVDTYYTQTCGFQLWLRSEKFVYGDLMVVFGLFDIFILFSSIMSVYQIHHLITD
ncbi:Tetraspanin [Cichlidogyrus casuarinus]|uniref:Tetraspanin n=1 Tax=Cichlidogyrus casuarinus TaxID=1844966 RepID=A0ABD2QNN1_9PLAT